MMTVLSCLAFEHDLRFTLLAALACVAGSLIAMRLLARVRRTDGGRRLAWLFLASFLAGATIWTTHFTAMLGYGPGISHGYDPELTFFSLLVAVLATVAGFSITAYGRSGPLVEIGGAVVGLGIAAMHYAGMAAFEVQGTKDWDMALVTASLVLGALFGAVAMNRLARPVTRFCRYGSAAAFILAICSMHFTGMGAVTITPDAAAFVPELLVPKGVLAAGVMSITVMILATGVSIHFIDVQNQIESVDRYRHLALHDPLTGLPNRAFFANRLSELVGGAADDTARTAVIAFDLNRFKQVNDVHGHAAGDAALREIAARLSQMLEADEFIARIGGDEFVAVKPAIFTRAEAAALAARVEKAVCEEVFYEDKRLTFGVSIGISVYPEDGRKADTLLSRADIAMYRAKTSEGSNICFYDRSMDESSRSRSELAMALRDAVRNGELELYYQAQNDTASRQLVGFEALLRWNHPRRGLVSPAEFIPIAEETGLICEIGEWVLRDACREAAGWQTPYRVSVNVAPLQLAQPNLPQIVHEALVVSGLAPARLELEITETGIIADQNHALHIMRQLKALGVRIAMDDYGTGYSSLATLKNFPFDKIKIDRSFVDGVNTSRQAAAIVRATIILGDSLEIPVLAEGVESEAHLAFLAGEGCQEVQGFFFGRPLPRAALHTLIEEARKPDAPAAAIEEPAPGKQKRPRAAA